jgi:hypothetical protein
VDRTHDKMTAAEYLDLVKWRLDEPSLSKTERDRTLEMDGSRELEVLRIVLDVLRIE